MKVFPDTNVLASALTTRGLCAKLFEVVLQFKGKQPFPSLPDADDEPIVASALARQAHVFVTGDKALLKLQQVMNLPLLSPRQFWGMLSTFDESN